MLFVGGNPFVDFGYHYAGGEKGDLAFGGAKYDGEPAGLSDGPKYGEQKIIR